MSKPAHNDVLRWGYENYLIDNRDFRRGFVEVNLADFAEVVYAAGFEAGKKDEREACAALHDSEDVLAPVGNSAWGEAYQDGWIAGVSAYREAIRAMGEV